MVAPYFFDLTWMPRNQKLPPKEAPLLAWEIYVARSTPSKYVGRVEAADADAAAGDPAPIASK